MNLKAITKEILETYDSMYIEERRQVKWELSTSTQFLVFNFTFQIVFKDPHSTKKKFTIKDFFSKCDKICSFLWIWSHLPKKSLMENFIYCAVPTVSNKCKNVPPVLLKYSFSPEVVFGAKHLHISPFSPGIII